MVSIFGYNISGYTVAFDANTGTNTMPVQNKVHNVNLTLSSNTFTKAGHIYHRLEHGGEWQRNGLC